MTSLLEAPPRASARLAPLPPPAGRGQRPAGGRAGAGYDDTRIIVLDALVAATAGKRPQPAVPPPRLNRPRGGGGHGRARRRRGPRVHAEPGAAAATGGRPRRHPGLGDRHAGHRRHRGAGHAAPRTAPPSPRLTATRTPPPRGRGPASSTWPASRPSLASPRRTSPAAGTTTGNVLDLNPVIGGDRSRGDDSGANAPPGSRGGCS